MPATVTPTTYGYRTEISAPLQAADVKMWTEEIRSVVRGRPAFSQLVDIRNNTARDEDTTRMIEETMQWVRANGLQRSAVIVASPTLKMQVQRLARNTGVDTYERYLDAASDPQWEQKALAWLERGVDPDA